MNEETSSIPERIIASTEYRCRLCKKTIPKGDTCWSIEGGHEHTNCVEYENRRDELIEMDAKYQVQAAINDLQVRYFR